MVNYHSSRKKQIHGMTSWKKMKKTVRREDSQRTGGKRSGRMAGGQIESKNLEDRQGMRVGNWKTGWQQRFLQTLSLS